MAVLLTVYWVCFGVGLVYVLLSGALGAVTHGLAGMHPGSGIAEAGHAGFEHGGHAGVEHAGHGAGAGHPHVEASLHGTNAGQHGTAGAAVSEEITSTDLDHDPSMTALAHAHAHGGPGHTAGDGTYSGAPEYSPFSLLSLMGALAGFGAGGLVASNYTAAPALSLVAAAGGGIVMALVLWLVIGKLLYGLHASSEAHVADMIGLEAEVLTPVEHGMSGEIAYILEGTRYTAPARLIGPGRVGKTDRVRIRRVGENLVYVEEKRKLLG